MLGEWVADWDTAEGETEPADQRGSVSCVTDDQVTQKECGAWGILIHHINMYLFVLISVGN